MPISIEEHEQQIFLLHWRGDVSLSEIQQSHEKSYATALRKQYAHYVHVIDVSEMTSFPVNVTGLWKVLVKHHETYHVLVVDAPALAKQLVNILNRITDRVTITTHDSVETALIVARKSLADRNKEQAPIRPLM